jgi:hypothetical protein
MRLVLLAALLAACDTPEPANALGSDPVFDEDSADALLGQAAPPVGTLTLDVPDPLYIGEENTVTLTGLYPGEEVYLLRSRHGLGAGPCFPSLGGECFDIVGPTRFLGAALADADGIATFTATIGAVPDGQVNHFQAVAARGFQGRNSLFSNPVSATTVVPVPRCTDDTATNFDPGANQDDGSCIPLVLDCPANPGGAVLAGPESVYGFCWYLGAGLRTCDQVCAEVGGSNLSVAAETSFPDACAGATSQDVSRVFYDNGNPGGWNSSTGGTSGRTLGYGYPGSSHYGKCAAGTAQTGTYPGEVHNTSLLRMNVCPCFTQ